MRAFSQLFRHLDETNKTSEKVDALERYFSKVEPENGAWAVFFLSGRRFKRLLKISNLRIWASEYSGIPDWLFEDCYEAVGDLAETIALLLPRSKTSSRFTLEQCIRETVIPLKSRNETEQKELVFQTWEGMDEDQRFVWNKIITGGFRVGVSQVLVIRSLSNVFGIEAPVVAHRMMGDWKPTAQFFEILTSSEISDAKDSRPYPFFLAYPLGDDPEILGDRTDWQVEWKWDGIRAQLIQRNQKIFLWSRGEELITERFPEIIETAKRIEHEFVLDGEVLPWQDDLPLPFLKLQKRIGRKKITKRILQEVPAILLAFDLLEIDGVDIRPRPLSERRLILESLVPGPMKALRISPIVKKTSWEDLRELRNSSRRRRVEGFMLKQLTSPYGVGRRKGDWWKWKIDPFTVDAVMIYAQRGHGRRASLYTDYTFAVWHEKRLVPFAKAYSGLTNEEIRQVDRFVRANTLERFGPVRSVIPKLVFEIAFESIQKSSRHKSGIAVRFPRIQRWRKDKNAADADRLEDLIKMADL